MWHPLKNSIELNEDSPDILSEAGIKLEYQSPIGTHDISILSII